MHARRALRIISRRNACHMVTADCLDNAMSRFQIREANIRRFQICEAKMIQPTCPNHSIPQLCKRSPEFGVGPKSKGPRSHGGSLRQRLISQFEAMKPIAFPSAIHSPRPNGFRYASSLALALLFVLVAPLRAADVTWTNGAGTSLWNLTDLNWSTGAWNNANGDGALFDATGAGSINVTSPINVDSMNLFASGYSFNGTGPLTFVNGTGTLASGVINVDPHFEVTINTPISSSIGVSKKAPGTLRLAGPMTFSGLGLPLTSATNILPVDIYAAGISLGTPSDYSGITRIMNSGVLPATTRLGVGNGLYDFGPLNLTLGSVTFHNDLDFFAFDPATRTAGIGITGTGTLRVTGEINVIGNLAGFNVGSNAIAPNLDFGGGTQVFRVSSAQLFNGPGALQMTGVLSNGSLLKTMGFNENGVMVLADGIGLFGNNTYTGSTRISGGSNVVTGTNASTFVEVFGSSNGSILTLQGANGSYLSASTLQAFSGGTLQIDNNAALGGAGNFNIPVPAAQNNNRLADNVPLQLRDGGFTYRGLANTAATETIGSVAVLGGHNVLNLATSGTGTVGLTVANDFTMVPRSSLAFNIATLGGTTKLFVNGTVPIADATGILPRVVTTSDFVTYNGVLGFTPYTAYATDFTTAGTNVSTTGAATVATSVNVNAVKSTNTATTTINAGQTLGVTSGMVLSASGTRTYAGGTMAFGSTPGAFFGTNTVSTTAITGSAGLLNAQGTLTLNGDLSGLTGTMTQNGFGQTTLVTNTFGGAIEVRESVFAINTSQTLAGQGAITLGVPTNDVDLVGAPPLLSISGAPASSTFARDIIVSNGSLTNNGVQLGNSFMTGLGVLSNSTGSQTISGNITLNSPFRIQGGGATGTGATLFPGNITGPSSIRVVNGRMTFSGNYSNAGGSWLGETGNVTQVTFNGTPGGTAPLIINGSNPGSFIAYTSGALPTGLISTNNSGPSGLANLTPLDNSTINNNFALNGVGYSFDLFIAGSGSVGANIGSGLSSIWTGQMTGLGGLVKSGPGILTLSNASNTYTGTTTVSAGTLLVNGSTSGSLMSVITGGTLGGTGPVGGITATNGTVAPGNGPAILTSAGNVTFNSGTTFKIEIGGVTAGTEYDRLQVTGAVNLGAGVTTLNGTLINGFNPSVGQQFTIIQCTGGVTGTFAQGSSINIGGTDFTIIYNANSVVLSVQAPTPTPTPSAGPSATPTPSPTPTATAAATPSPTPSPTSTPAPTPTPTPSPTAG